MNHMKVWSFAALLLGLYPPVAWAQQTVEHGSASVPRLVQFSGAVTGFTGRPVIGITFALYKNQQGGVPVWAETQNVPLDEGGRYTVLLGSARPEGLPPELFTSGEARWLGVELDGQPEQPRVLLLSVPYALKAADAETLAGFPASAFVLAAPPVAASAATESDKPADATASVTGLALAGSGTLDFIPLWTPDGNTLGNSSLFQSGSSNIGIGTQTPASKLDVKGGATIRGTLTLPSAGAATASTGKNSQPLSLAASTFNSSIGAAVNETFRWQAEPVGNNTASTSGTLNLLFGSGSGTPTETGLQIASNGIVTFASGQTFPGGGTGTVTSVGLSAPATDFTVTGSPVTTSGTLGLNWNIAPTSINTPNAIVKRDSNGNIIANVISAAVVNATNSTLNGSLTVGAGATVTSSGAAITGTSSGTSSGSIGVEGVTSSGSAYGVAGVKRANSSTAIGVYGNSAGYGVCGSGGIGAGVYGTGATGVFGTGSQFGFVTDSNVQQARTAGGWVKAMVYVNADLAPYSIINCFNSYQPAAAPPCGINFTESQFGIWDFDFGFQVSDRFLSATLGGTGGSGNCIEAYPKPSSNTTVEVVT